MSRSIVLSKNTSVKSPAISFWTSSLFYSFVVLPRLFAIHISKVCQGSTKQITMAIRGQRFHIDLGSDEEADVPKPTKAANQAPPLFGLVDDVKERAATFETKIPPPPKLRSTETGFPTHRNFEGSSTFKRRRAREALVQAEHATQSESLPPVQHSQSELNSEKFNADPRSEDSLTDETERQRIDEENKQRLAEMSPEEIEEARQELMNGLSPSLIERLLKKANIDDEPTSLEQRPRPTQEEVRRRDKNSTTKRVTFKEPEPTSPRDPRFSAPPDHTIDPGAFSLASALPPEDSYPPQIDPSSPNFLSKLHDKYFPDLPSDPSTLSWMQPLPEKSSYDPSAESLPAAALRFDFRGRLLPPRLSSQLPSTLGLHHHADAPSSAGYTVPELAHLARSTFPAQRCIAMQTLGRLLYRLGRGDFGREGDELCEGLWVGIERGRVIDNLVEAAGGDGGKGNRSMWVTATEAVWLWRKGGGRRWKGR